MDTYAEACPSEGLADWIRVHIDLFAFLGGAPTCQDGPDYHIEIDGHWYSAPYRLIRELVDARIDDRTVEIFHNGRRIASHARAPNRRGHTTIADHVSSVCDKTNASMMRATSLAC